MSFQCYADDTRIYLTLISGRAQCIKHLQKCLLDIKSWMELNFLCLDENKTEILDFAKTDLLIGWLLGLI